MYIWKMGGRVELDHVQNKESHLKWSVQLCLSYLFSKHIGYLNCMLYPGKLQTSWCAGNFLREKTDACINIQFSKKMDFLFYLKIYLQLGRAGEKVEPGVKDDFLRGGGRQWENFHQQEYKYDDKMMMMMMMMMIMVMMIKMMMKMAMMTMMESKSTFLFL